MTNINQAAFFQKHLNVCFSGHRPNKLPDAGDLSQPAMNAVYHDLLIMIDNAVTEGKSNFIHGMMSGFDIIAAEAVLEIKKKHPHIRLISVLPFIENFFMTKEWYGDWARRATEVYKESDCRVCLAKSYYPQVYYDRNKWMIEHSSLLICYQSSGKGGTAYTVNSAEKNGVPVINLALYRDKLTGAKRFLS